MMTSTALLGVYLRPAAHWHVLTSAGNNAYSCLEWVRGQRGMTLAESCLRMTILCCGSGSSRRSKSSSACSCQLAAIPLRLEPAGRPLAVPRLASDPSALIESSADCCSNNNGRPPPPGCEALLATFRHELKHSRKEVRPLRHTRDFRRFANPGRV